MKTKQLFMPLALIFFALLLGMGEAKAQVTKDVYLYVASNNHQDQGWQITYHNDDTDTDYNFDTTNGILAENLYNEGMTILGGLPYGNYTVTVTQLSAYSNIMNDFYIGTDGPYYNVVLGYNDTYTFSTTVVVSATDDSGSSDLMIALDAPYY